MSIRQLVSLLEPRSIAVFGACEEAGSVGTTVWRSLRAGGFAGSIHAISPEHAQLDGERVFKNAAELPGVPDLPVPCTPPATIDGLWPS